MSRRGLLIAVEGIDGAGKTTLARGIVKRIQDKGMLAHYTMEPTHNLIGELIRSLTIEYRDPRIEALLYAADRLHHYLNEIKVKLDEGYIVVVDRYIYSSIAYQGALGAPIDWIRLLNRYVPKPHLAFYIDIPIDVALKRIKTSRLKHSFYEEPGILERARRIYLDLVSQGELILLDGTKPPEIIIDKALGIIENYLRRP